VMNKVFMFIIFLGERVLSIFLHSKDIIRLPVQS